jgi:hypothetical protein
VAWTCRRGDGDNGRWLLFAIGLVPLGIAEAQALCRQRPTLQLGGAVTAR